jgi:hypothetical protein
MAGDITMCDRCETIERQLLNYRDAHSSADDALAIVLLAGVIEDLETERSGLHPVDGGDKSLPMSLLI